MTTTSLFGYFAGSLFNNKDLTGNCLLAQKILELSDSKFIPILPQNLEQRSLNAASIRSNDLLALAKADWAIFHFDGTELDSGTVVEHEFAKVLDIPYLIIRSDFRLAGDANDLPWNLMNRPNSRGSVLSFDCVSLYQAGLKSKKGDSSLGEKLALDLLSSSISACDYMHTQMAHVIVAELERVIKTSPILTPDELEQSANILSKTTGEDFDKYLCSQTIQKISLRRSQI